MIELKPCPFCGRKVDIASMRWSGFGAEYIEVDCYCGASIQIESDALVTDWNGLEHQLGRSALEKWNTRADIKTENSSENPNKSEIPTGSTISKMEQVEEPQNRLDKCYKCKWWNYSYGCKCKKGICEFEPLDEPQTDCQWK